jgi:hypothetical protein
MTEEIIKESWMDRNKKLCEIILAVSQIVFVAFAGYVLATTITYRAGYQDGMMAAQEACKNIFWRP